MENPYLVTAHSQFRTGMLADDDEEKNKWEQEWTKISLFLQELEIPETAIDAMKQQLDEHLVFLGQYSIATVLPNINLDAANSLLKKWQQRKLSDFCNWLKEKRNPEDFITNLKDIGSGLPRTENELVYFLDEYLPKATQISQVLQSKMLSTLLYIKASDLEDQEFSFLKKWMKKKIISFSNAENLNMYITQQIVEIQTRESEQKVSAWLRQER
jgi:hypothetical protein